MTPITEGEIAYVEATAKIVLARVKGADDPVAENLAVGALAVCAELRRLREAGCSAPTKDELERGWG